MMRARGGTIFLVPEKSASIVLVSQWGRGSLLDVLHHWETRVVELECMQRYGTPMPRDNAPFANEQMMNGPVLPHR